MKKRIISIITIISTAAALVSSFTTTASAVSYTDVPSDHWAYESIQQVSDMGAFSGYTDGTFKPSNTMTHEEFLKTVIEIVAPNSITPVRGYAQVATNNSSDPQFWTNHWASWAQPYLTRALELGLICDSTQAGKEKVAKLLGCYDEAILSKPFGNEDGLTYDKTFYFDDTDHVAPNTPVTREEAARIVTRAMYVRGEKLDNGYKRGIEKNDERFGMWGVSPEYYKDVSAAYNFGIIGVDNNYMYNPQKSLTRAEAAAVLVRIADKNKRFNKASDWSATLNKMNDTMNYARECAINILTGHAASMTVSINKPKYTISDYPKGMVEGFIEYLIVKYPLYRSPDSLEKAVEVADEYAPLVKRIYDGVIAGTYVPLAAIIVD